MNSIPPFSQNRGDIKYIKIEILQIVSSSEDVKFSNVRGLYLRKYGICPNPEGEGGLGPTALRCTVLLQINCHQTYGKYSAKILVVDRLNRNLFIALKVSKRRIPQDFFSSEF